MSSSSMPARVPAKPLSIRFTEAEKAILREKAAGVPLGVFIRQAVLHGEAKPRRSRRHPVKDGQALGQVLAILGASRMANNLNQLAKAANLGALPVTKEVEEDLATACADVATMRSLLLQALGLEIFETVREPLSQAFAQSAGMPE